MSITPEQCAELHRNEMGYIGAIYNRSIELLHNPNLAALTADSVQNQKAIASLPAILTLVAEQQQRIEELESVIKLTYKQNCGRDLEHLPLNEAVEQSIANGKRESLQRAAELCEELADALQSSDCSDCAETIKEEMESL